MEHEELPFTAPPPQDHLGRWSGFVMILLGLVLLLALVSYTPHDLPIMGLLQDYAIGAEAQSPRSNILGAVGTWLGWMQVMINGAAAYLLPSVLIALGLAKCVKRTGLFPLRFFGMVLLIISAAAAIGMIEHGFEVWKHRFVLMSPGGVMGYLLGDLLLRRSMGKGMGLLLLGCVYLLSLMFLIGHTPWSLLQALLRRNDRHMEQRKEDQRLERAHKQTEERNPRRKPEAKGKKEKVPRPSSRRVEELSSELESGKFQPLFEPESDEPQQFLPLKTTPPPQIIDANARKPSKPAPGEKPFAPSAMLGAGNAPVAEYDLPGFDLLDASDPDLAPQANRLELQAIQRNIIDTLKSFGIEVTAGDITCGPTITRYEIYPSTGLRVSRIAQLEADIARATRAERINILAPIPGKDTVGIEIANNVKVAVPLRELLQDPEFRSPKNKIPLALGKDVYGKTVIGDLAAMPHLLVAGATGSGKSVCINSIIASILFKFSPQELRFIMVDPKVVEMQIYNRLPHLVVPVVTDPKKTVAALRWVVNEMEKRYRIFAAVGVRNFDGYNKRPITPKPISLPDESADDEEEVDMEAIESIAAALESGELGPEEDEDLVTPDEEQFPDRFPYIVVLIDELADLMQTAPTDVEGCIARIAQKARAAGIHLIIATQTPRADVVTGIIKANIPSRIAFQVSSQLDSRVILDVKGAEKLVGKGDMLYLPPGSAKLERSQGAFVSDAEVERLVEHCSAQASPQFEKEIRDAIDSGHVGGGDEEEDSDVDEAMVIKCIEVIRTERKASASLLQRRLRLGYARAARMLDVLEQRGLIGPGDGARPREVYIADD